MISSRQEIKFKFNSCLMFKNYRTYSGYSLLLSHGVHKSLIEIVISLLMQVLKICVANVKEKENLKALPLNGLFYSESQRIPFFPTHLPTPVSSTCLPWGPLIYQLGVISSAQGIVILLGCKLPWQE